MIEILASWIWIGLCAWTVGFGTILLLEKVLNETYYFSADMIFITGLCVLTVYAQTFSLFYKVGMIANVVLLLIVVILIFFLRKQLVQYVRQIFVGHNRKIIFSILLVTGIIMLIKGNQAVNCIDSSLYHGQAIRWIEEYGVVPGLGNLHSRFAFNSSFLVLQALFSMKFLVGRSLHSVNAFFDWILLAYGLLSIKTFRTKKFMISDGLRLSAFFVINITLNMSSPNTDLMSSGMMIYILIKWVSMWEDGEEYQHFLPYALLCILGVWAASLKVSSGAVAIMTVFVAWKLMKNRKWKDIGVYILSGIVVALPWIVRNVVISGYILYPYGAVDIFDVDWKMPMDVVKQEAAGTTAWARESVIVGQGIIETSIFGWIPKWFLEQHILFKILFVVSIIAIFIGLICCTIKIISKRDMEYISIYLTMLVCFVVWFFGAPAIRFAPACVTMIPCFVFGELYQKHTIKIIESHIIGVLVIACIICNKPLIQCTLCDEQGNVLYSTDYPSMEVESINWNGITMYYSADGSNLTGYDPFPSTPYIRNLENLYLRGSSLESGFRKID